jgi:hypothetical protein
VERPGNSPPQVRTAFPDRILLLPSGRIFFAELKAPGRKLRPLQKRRKIQLEHLGFTVFVIDSPEQIDEVLRQMKGSGE